MTTSTSSPDKFARTLLYVLIGISAAILILNIVLVFTGKPEGSTNKSLIDYMETQRRRNDTLETNLSLQYQRALSDLQARESSDSQQLSLTARQITTSINQLKTSYETIPSYSDVFSDSLRRLFADRFR